MKKLLIYDDEQDILDVCRLILGKMYQIETLNKVVDPIKEVIQYQPDLVLFDVWIPDLGGEESTRRLKESDLTRSTPVILFSANNQLPSIAKASGADGYLMKPFNIETLKKTIELYIK